MSVAYRDAIKYLRPMADNYVLPGVADALETAIRAIEDVERLKEDLRSATDRCKFCVQMTKPLLCLGSDYLCHECNQHDCVCQDCKDGSKWEWRGGNG